MPAKTAVETAAPELIRQDHGGALLHGGLPGNRGGGRLGSQTLKWAALRSPDAQKAIEEILEDSKHPQRLSAAKLVLEICHRAGMSIEDQAVATLSFLALLRELVTTHAGTHVGNMVMKDLAARLGSSTSDLASSAIVASLLNTEG